MRRGVSQVDASEISRRVANTNHRSAGLQAVDMNLEGNNKTLVTGDIALRPTELYYHYINNFEVWPITETTIMHRDKQYQYRQTFFILGIKTYRVQWTLNLQTKPNAPLSNLIFQKTAQI